MPKLKKHERESHNFMMLLLLGALALMAIMWLMKSIGVMNVRTSSAVPGYQSSADLDAASQELDGADLNRMDDGINGLGADYSSF